MSVQLSRSNFPSQPSNHGQTSAGESPDGEHDRPRCHPELAQGSKIVDLERHWVDAINSATD